MKKFLLPMTATVALGLAGCYIHQENKTVETSRSGGALTTSGRPLNEAEAICEKKGVRPHTEAFKNCVMEVRKGEALRRERKEEEYQREKMIRSKKAAQERRQEEMVREKKENAARQAEKMRMKKEMAQKAAATRKQEAIQRQKEAEQKKIYYKEAPKKKY